MNRMSSSRPARHGVFALAPIAALVLINCPAWAQETATLPPVVVTGNPLATAEQIAPAEQLSGTVLLERGQSTLGETLKGLPGVSSTWFGPNASRPVIRGQDGDRIAILNNGGASLDLSALSYDHAVTLDPLLTERVEVLRGPGVLQYGGNAVGGVVNVIDNRIPRTAEFGEEGGVSGRLGASYATGSDERGGVLSLDGGNRRYALHVDAMARKSDDVEVPVSRECTTDGVTRTAKRICNSASESSGGAVGGTLFFDRGYLGASVSTYDKDYGTVAEDEVTIKMRSDRVALEGELRDLGPVLRSVKAQFSQTDYEHTEYEGDDVGTRFKTDGQDLRLEARHVPVDAFGGALDGVVGLQFDRADFSANGDEAYAPSSRTRQSAVFAYEELGLGWGKLSAGARVESVKVESFGADGNLAFTTGTRSFTPTSYALGALWNVASEWKLTSNVSLNERAPRHYELYANGEHVATNAEEIGNPDLDLERSVNVDVGTQWQRGAHKAQLQLFQHRFSNYISLESTDPASDPPQYTYTEVRARFTGLEVSGNVRLLDALHKLDLGLSADRVEAENTSTGEPLPRIAPLRVGATLRWSRAAWNAGVGVDRYVQQDRVPDGQETTDGYTLWNASLNYSDKLGGMPALWYARVDNMGDVEAYSASSILTQTAPGKAPLPGRSLKVGMQLSF
ncbi:TonB-dependent receptor [Hylemonella gracilis]|uniref:TonB-dependent receptor n=2 Tax=Hylemonella gracilis TaxID=80880 RepID=A0A4P6UJ94_9BURK|nr:TonB-dependent receptor [Hylemonella gracilis]